MTDSVAEVEEEKDKCGGMTVRNEEELRNALTLSGVWR